MSSHGTARFTGPETIDALTADREKMWHGFTNATFGVIFEPLKAFSVSVDWYYIKLTNDIISASSAGGFYTDAIALVRGAPAKLPQCTITAPTGSSCDPVSVFTPVGYPAYTVIPYVNAGSTKTSGYDLDMRSQFDLGDFGRLKAEINYTFIAQYELIANDTIFNLVGTHGPQSISGDTGNPRQRAVASVTWEEGPFTSTVSVNYQSSFSIVDPSSGYSTCLQALQGRSPSAYGSAISSTVTALPSQWNQYCAVQHFTDVNLYAAYQANDHLQLHGSITNLFNSQPPVDLQTYGGGAELAYSTLDQDGAVPGGQPEPCGWPAVQHGVRRERTALDSSRTSASERLVTLHSLLKLFNAARPQ